MLCFGTALKSLFYSQEDSGLCLLQLTEKAREFYSKDSNETLPAELSVCKSIR